MNQTPNVTPADIEACIASEHYGTAQSLFDFEIFDEGADTETPHPSLELLSLCVLVTRNGHTVVGHAHCQDPAKYDEKTGHDAARADAVRQLWPMVVYAARERLKPVDPEAATDTQDAS